MSRRPTFTTPIRVPQASYDNHNPVSAWRAIVLRNNIQHWVNLSAQHRINWVAPITPPLGESTWVDSYWFDNTEDGADLPDAAVRYYSQEFVHTWMRGDVPTGLDIVIAGLVGDAGGDDLLLAARIVPASAPYNDLGVEALWSATAQTTGPDTVCVIEEQVMFTNAIGHSGMFIEHAIEEDGVLRSPRQGLLRLEVAVTIPEDDMGGIIEVMVREFACHP